MSRYKILFLSSLCIIYATSCKKQLNVGNPNQPTVAQNVVDEGSLAQFGQGAVYVDGFQYVNAYNWLGSSYFSLNYGYAELLADLTGSTDANEIINTINIPSYAIFDDGTKTPVGEPQSQQLRTGNTRASTSAGYNALYYEWEDIYLLNGSCNSFLATIPNIKSLSADAVSTFEAWGYFWKGYAYSVIGSQYTAGVISNVAGTTNGHYLIKDSIIAESNYWLNLAATTLGGISAGSAEYAKVMGELIPPDFQQTTHGAPPTTTAFIHNINTLLARNILVNKLSTFVNGTLGGTISKASVPAISTSDWQSVITLTSNGVQPGDGIFIATSSGVNSYYGQGNGNITLMLGGSNSNTVFQPGLRLTQNYNSGDQRLALDFTASASDTFYNDLFSTVYSMISGSNGTTTVYNYSDADPGAYETVIAGSFEENTLMQAEADIMTGNVEAGLSLIDAERNYQGAGVAAVAGTGLTQTQAYNQLVRERRVALFGRGLSFYDSRRWGWSYDITQGGGSYGNMVLWQPATGHSIMYHNVTFDYNFMDYWDVPADEVILNPPSSATAGVVTNPNY
jgi:starch-binding outer membrane protein, SusD/RagB family